MAYLPSLPQELQLLIIEFVLLGERAAPEDLKSACVDRVLSINDEHVPDLSLGSKKGAHIRYEDRPNVTNADGLLLANRHFNYHTKAAVHRLFPQGPDCKLDILFIEDRQLWPTWLRVPCTSHEYGTIEVTVRMAPTSVSTSPDSVERRRDLNVFPPWMKEIYHSLWEDFFHFGLHPPGTSGKTPTQFSRCPTFSTWVKKVNVDFVSTNIDKESADTEQDWWRFFRQGRDEHHIPDDQNGSVHSNDVSHPPPSLIQMRAVWLLNLDALVSILTMGAYTYEYDGDLYGHLGAISVSARGHHLQDVLLGEKLARLELYYENGRFSHPRVFNRNLPDACQVPAFWAWKHSAFLKRKQRGLPVDDQTFIWPTQEQLRSWKEAVEKAAFQRAIDGCSEDGKIHIEMDDVCDTRELEMMLERHNQSRGLE